jgi:hypothetical protein
MLNGKSDYQWQQFASNNNLTFKPDNDLLLRKAHVVGDYCGYRVRLDASAEDQIIGAFWENDAPLDRQQIETWMTLKAKRSSPTLTNKDKAIFGKKFDVDFLLPADAQRRVKGRFYASNHGRKIVYRQEGFEHYVEYLQFVLDTLKDLIEIYPAVVGLGGEVVPVLYRIARSDHVLQHVARELLFDIGKDTKKQFRKRSPHLLCPECWVHYDAHSVNVSWSRHITYYGCRACGQSRSYLPVDGRRLVALLDRESDIEKTIDNRQIRVNWIEYRKPFDFEEVEILQATDEDVERFAVQMGNDTDPFRSSRYKKVCCTISSDCRLSENTMRVLQKVFGRMEVKDFGYLQP